jgi:hypothetical protein
VRLRIFQAGERAQANVSGPLPRARHVGLREQPPPRRAAGYAGDRSGDIAIARVQSSFWGKGFRFFPNGQSRIGCRIPGPGAEGIDGICETRVALTRIIRASAIVTFTESWPAKKFRTHGPPKGTLHHSWRFAVTTGGRVVRLGDRGAFPPQASD